MPVSSRSSGRSHTALVLALLAVTLVVFLPSTPTPAFRAPGTRVALETTRFLASMAAAGLLASGGTGVDQAARRPFVAALVLLGVTDLWFGVLPNLGTTDLTPLQDMYASAPTMGLADGCLRGRVDTILSRISDIILSFPVLVLYILIIATIGSSGINIIIAITFASAPGIMRIVRGLVLDLRNRDYVAAAQTRGESAWHIMLVEILPNARGPLIVDACLRLGYVIITIGVLGFLGLGLPPPDPDWGGMINETRSMALAYPHMTVIPCIAISSLILGFNLLADGLREISLRD